MFPLTVAVGDGVFTVSQAVQLEVNRPPVLAAISSPMSAHQGMALSQSFTATDPDGDTLIWSLSGALPTGVSFAAGQLSGTPQTGGLFPLTVAVSDGALTVSQTVQLEVNQPPVLGAISSPVLAHHGVALSQSFTATDADGDTLTWSLSGNLPTGVSFAAGQLSGTPQVGGVFPFTLSVSDGVLSATASAQLVVNHPPVLAANSGSFNLMTGQPFAVSFSASDADGDALVWSLTGSLPAGLSFSAGVLSGVPTAAGSFALAVEVSDGMQAVSAGFVLDVSTVVPASLALVSPLAGAVLSQSQPVLSVVLTQGNGAGFAVAQAQLWLGGSEVSASVAAAGNTWSLSPVTPLTDGPFTAQVVLVNSESQTLSVDLSFSVDTVASITGLSVSAATDPVQAGAQVLVTLAAAESGSAAGAGFSTGETLALTDNGLGADALAGDHVFSGYYAVTGATPVGGVSVSGFLTDSLGNTTAYGGVSPSFTVAALGRVLGSVARQTVGGADGVTLTLSSSQAGWTPPTLSADALGNYVFENLLTGEYQVTATHPQFGLTASEVITLPVAQDVTLGLLTVPDSTAPSLSETGGLSGAVVSQSSPVMSFVASDGGVGISPAGPQLWLDSTPQAAPIPTGGDGYSFTPAAPLADGPHTVLVQAADDAGNTGEVSFSFTVDTTALPVSLTENTGGAVLNVGSTVHFSLNAGEAGGGATVSFGNVSGLVLHDNGTGGDAVAGDGVFELDFVLSQGAIQASASQLVGVVADVLGNTASITASTLLYFAPAGGWDCSFDVSGQRQTCNFSIGDPAASVIELTNLSGQEQEIVFSLNGRHLLQSTAEAVAEAQAQGAANAWGNFGNTIFNYLRAQAQNYTPLNGDYWLHNPALFLNSLGFGYCDDLSAVFSGLAKAGGKPGRVWSLTDHVVSELYDEGRWQMYDADFQVTYVNGSSQVVGVETIAINPNDYLLVEAPGSVVGDYPDINYVYATTADNVVDTWYDSYYPDRPVRLRLPPGGSLSLPGRFLPSLSVLYGGQTSTMFTHLRQMLPAGLTGNVESGLVLHALSGDATVRVLGLDFNVGNPAEADALQALLDTRSTWVSNFEILEARSPLTAYWLLNPRRFSLTASTELVIEAADPLAIQATVQAYP